VIPSVDQETGEAGFVQNIKETEPLQTLRRLRSGGVRYGVTGLLPMTMGGSRGWAPLFGVYVGTEGFTSSQSIIKEGDEVVVNSYRNPPSVLAEFLHFASEVFSFD
jgi:hypothetical protein